MSLSMDQLLEQYRSDRDGWRKRALAAESRAAALEAELARLRPVVEAADRRHPGDPLSFAELRAANVPRCETAFHAVDKWTPTDWACALAGEAGETCNAVKKLKRLTDGIEPDKTLTDGTLLKAIGKEIADTIIYADLLAARLGIDLGAAVRAKFNEVSARVGSPIVLAYRASTPRTDGTGT